MDYDYREYHHESQTEREWDEKDKLGEDDPVDYRWVRHFGKDEELEKDKDH